MLLLRSHQQHFKSHLAVSLISELDFQDLFRLNVSCGSSQKLDQRGFTTANRALKQHRLLGCQSQGQSSQVVVG